MKHTNRKKYTYEILVGIPATKTPIWRSNCRWNCNI